uniref:hypothetical protein n=1 Tax=Ensifer adhaerens TaxID=106592 RepID=UPI00202F0EE4
ASLVLLQNDDDLFVCETVALHSLVLSMGQSLLQNGLFQRGKVNWFLNRVPETLDFRCENSPRVICCFNRLRQDGTKPAI